MSSLRRVVPVSPTTFVSSTTRRMGSAAPSSTEGARLTTTTLRHRKIVTLGVEIPPLNMSFANLVTTCPTNISYLKRAMHQQNWDHMSLQILMIIYKVGSHIKTGTAKLGVLIWQLNAYYVHVSKIDINCSIMLKLASDPGL